MSSRSKQSIHERYRELALFTHKHIYTGWTETKETPGECAVSFEHFDNISIWVAVCNSSFIRLLSRKADGKLFHTARQQCNVVL